MKASRDDMPEYLRTRKKAGPWRFLALLGLGSAIFWMLALMFGKEIIIDINQIKSGIRFADKPVFEAEPEAPQVSALEERQISVDRKAMVLAELLSAQKQPAIRQTSFNDQNYQPTGAINTMPAPKPALYAASTQSKRVPHKPVLQTGHWTRMGADRKGTRHKIEWQTVNGWIQYHTVCQNERRGSIEYRDCRKAAKEYFVHRCRTEKRKAFCAVENNYNPL
ncbi:MAG TPA: hypothetical protein DC032_12900 [Pseudomonas sp.]|nr:hypothetical protein [Pseudomonas sp.]